MKKNKTLIIAIVTLLSTLTLTGCKKENKYVRVGCYEDVAGINLVLTGKATGKQNVSTYTLFDKGEGYANRMINKMNSKVAGIDIAYFDVADLGKVIENTNLHVVFVDTYNLDGSIKGVWVARDSWSQVCKTYFSKYVLGMAKSLDYRYNNSKLDGSFHDLKVKLETGDVNKENFFYKFFKFTDFNFQTYTNIYEYCAIYEIENVAKADQEKFEVNEFTFNSLQDSYDMYKDFSAGQVGYEKCKAVYDSIGKTSQSFDDFFNLETMTTKMEDALKPAEKKEESPIKAILIGVGGVVVLGGIITYLVYRRKKTGKKLFDIKAALDADIEK